MKLKAGNKEYEYKPRSLEKHGDNQRRVEEMFKKDVKELVELNEENSEIMKLTQARSETGYGELLRL